MWERMKMHKGGGEEEEEESEGPEGAGLTDGCYGDGYAAQHCI